ncbi:two-component system sensor histidine kinase CreC [Escherichia coli]
MRIGMRLLLGYFLLVAVAAWFVLAIFVKEVKPGVRRATEGTLIDTATLLAELARPDLLSGDPTHGQLAQAFNQLQHRPFRANIGGINKVRNEYHVYMTDSQGKVLFDSANKAVGQDYSRWNDVWLTLRGQYGARSTLQNPADPESSVMYVAAPIMDGSRLIGVLSVGKPNAAMAPVIKRSERRILWASAILLGIALVIGAGMVWWINRSIARLTRYADSVTDNKPVPLPELGSSELRKLAQALESMRVKLEGKNYIEQYVYALTHELKKPTGGDSWRGGNFTRRSATGSGARFTDNILTQNARMQALVETLLRQARLENRQEVVLTVVDVAALFRRVSEARTVQLAEKNITLHVMPTEVNVAAEPALLEQALGNLLDNAIDFTPESGRITLSAEVDQEHVALKVLDTGSGIPDYALSRIFERFYSLPRANGQKSSGLGLAFVSEVARLFNGEVTLRNVQEGGVLASLRLHRHFT